MFPHADARFPSLRGAAFHVDFFETLFDTEQARNALHQSRSSASIMRTAR
jgi:hypothetical protein